MRLDELGALLDRFSANEDMEGRLMFADRPDRWYDDPHWRCVNDHVNPEPVAGYRQDVHELEYSHQLCPECHTLVRLTFPEDVSGPLGAPKAVL